MNNKSIILPILTLSLFFFTLILVFSGRIVNANAANASSSNTNVAMCYSEAARLPQSQRESFAASCIAKSTPVWSALQAKQASTAVFNGYGMLGSIQTAIITAGPKLAGRLSNVSGQIFGILTVLAFIWLVMPMWFKGMDIGAVVMFWVKVLVLYGMLREYNYFWNEGVVGFFIYLTKTVTGGENLLPVLVNNFVGVLNDMQLQVGGGWWAKVMGTLNGKILLLGIEEIIVAISFLVSIGTVFLVEIYIVIALVTGYIFIPFAVIKQGEFLFNGWLKFLISSAFSYFLVSLIVTLFSTILPQIPSHYASWSSSMVNEMLWIGVLAMFAYIIMKIPSLAGEIISGTPNISVGGAVAGAVGAISIMTGIGRAGAAAAPSVRAAGSRASEGADKYLTAHSGKYRKVKDFAKKANRFGKSE